MKKTAETQFSVTVIQRVRIITDMKMNSVVLHKVLTIISLIFLICCIDGNPRYWNDYYAEREQTKLRSNNPMNRPSCPELEYCYRQCPGKKYFTYSDYYNTASRGRSPNAAGAGHQYQCEIDCRNEIFCNDLREDKGNNREDRKK